MVEIECGLDLLVEQRTRLVASPHAPFLEHDAPFRGQLVFGDDQIVHPVGLQPHDELQLVGRDGLEIGGVVPRGEGVLLAADARDPFREFLGLHRLGAAEHQMFEEMGGARAAALLVGGADLVPDPVRHGRCPVVRHDDDLQPVLEREALFAEPGFGGPARPGDDGGDQRREESEAHERTLSVGNF